MPLLGEHWRPSTPPMFLVPDALKEFRDSYYLGPTVVGKPRHLILYIGILLCPLLCERRNNSIDRYVIKLIHELDSLIMTLSDIQ